MIYRQIDNSTGELKFYGEVSEWWINGEDFTRTLQEMESKFATIIIRAHCYGGSVFEGTVIYNAIVRCKSKVIVKIDGVAASMMSIIMLAADEIIIAQNGFIMVHCPTAMTAGNAKDISATVKLLQSMEKNFASIYAKRTGKPEKDVQKWLDGADHWFDAEEAKSEGLVTAIEQPVVANILQLDKPIQNGEVENVFGRFAALLSNEPINPDTKNKNANSTMKKDVIAKFNLSGVTENSTDAEVLAALTAKFGSLEEAQKAQTTAAINALIDSTEKASGKKFEDEQRASLVAVGEKAGLEALQTMLGMTATVVGESPDKNASSTSIPRVVTMTTSQGASVTEARKDWGWDKWQEEDPEGVEAMEKNDPEAFKALYKAKFGVVPVLS